MCSLSPLGANKLLLLVLVLVLLLLLVLLSYWFDAALSCDTPI